MRRAFVAAGIAVFVLASLAGPSVGRDRPHSSAKLFLKKWTNSPKIYDTGSGSTGGGLSKTQIERYRCASSGTPTTYVDMSCDEPEPYGQDWAPDNEIAVAVNPTNPDHIVAGSNDYFYRFNNSTGARHAIVPTGFFTSFDGGATWEDGQIPLGSGNGAGDPAPAFDRRHETVMMAQLENTGGQGGCCVSQGDVSVSRSTDGGLTWRTPVTVMKGKGTGIGPANNATFFDKEWMTVDNNPTSDFYGRAYVTSTRFLNNRHGAYEESPIWLSWSDDGGRTWIEPKEISGSHPSCTFQEFTEGDATETDCDEDQFSIPEVASDGTLYVHFINAQNDAEFEAEAEFDSQIMVVRSSDGGETFDGPFQAVQLEDGLSDMPFSVIGRQTVWGHQIRWTAVGTISVNPTNPLDVTVVWADRGTPNPNATDECIQEDATAENDYDPCNAGPGSELNVYFARSTDGGETWGSGRTLLDGRVGAAWFPWADHKSDGTLVAAWDQDDTASPADTYHHVLKVGGGAPAALGPSENPDVSVTHWSGQYVPEDSWPTICGPAGYTDPPVTNAEGKDCNAFHGDYTGLAVDSLNRIHVVWTGLNVFETSPQIDFYTGEPHDGYVQDAMYARR